MNNHPQSATQRVRPAPGDRRPGRLSLPSTRATLSRLSAVTGLLVLAFGMGGCARGVRWEYGSFEDVQRRSQSSGRLMFVYFRNWYRVECTNFEEQTLKDPQVLTETDQYTCVPLDYDYDRRLAERWGIEQVPAYAIVTPDGQLLTQQQPPITREDLLAELRGARARPAPPSQPAETATQQP